MITVFLVIAGCKDDDVKVANSSAQVKQPIAIARGKIDVDGGVIPLSFLSEGVISKVMVSEGQKVQKGQLLMQQDKRVFFANKKIAQDELLVANTQLQQLNEQIPEFRKKVQRLNLAAEAGALQMQISDDAQASLKQTESNMHIAQAQSKLAQSKLKQVEVQGSLLDLRAPFDGVITKINVQPGGLLPNGQNALVLLPNKPIIIRAELNESYLELVKNGMIAKVQIENDSGGVNLPPARVIRISPVFIQSQLQENNQQSREHIVECILEFQDPNITTRIGQNVIVSFYE